MRAILRVGASLRLSVDGLPGTVVAALRDRFRTLNPAWRSGVERGVPAAKLAASGIRQWLYCSSLVADELTLPRGAIRDVRTLLAEHGVTCETRDETTIGGPL